MEWFIHPMRMDIPTIVTNGQLNLVSSLGIKLYDESCM